MTFYHKFVSIQVSLLLLINACNASLFFGSNLESKEQRLLQKGARFIELLAKAGVPTDTISSYFSRHSVNAIAPGLNRMKELVNGSESNGTSSVVNVPLDAMNSIMEDDSTTDERSRRSAPDEAVLDDDTRSIIDQLNKAQPEVNACVAKFVCEVVHDSRYDATVFPDRLSSENNPCETRFPQCKTDQD